MYAKKKTRIKKDTSRRSKISTQAQVLNNLQQSKLVENSTGPMFAFCPSASSTSAFNYYGSNAEARETAYQQVLKHIEDAKKHVA